MMLVYTAKFIEIAELTSRCLNIIISVRLILLGQLDTHALTNKYSIHFTYNN